MDMGSAPTWLRQVSPPPPASQDTLTTGFSVQKYPTMLCASMFSKHDDDWDDGDDDNNAYSQESNDDNY